MKLNAAYRIASTVQTGVTPFRLVRIYKYPVRSNREISCFISMLRERPQGNAWLIEKGRLARCLRIPYPHAKRLVRAHIKKLCGYRNPKWIEDGLREGYETWGLTA